MEKIILLTLFTTPENLLILVSI